MKLPWMCMCWTVVVCLLVRADEDHVLENGEDKIICNYAGKEYKHGEEIETPDNVCLHCTCWNGWTEPSSRSCAIIDCPWGYYSSKPHCFTEYVQGQCCPELKCSAQPPDRDAGFLTGKRVHQSTHGYNISAEVGSEISIYCIGDNSTENYADKEVKWSHDGNVLSNTTKTQMAFFPPAIWAVYFPKLEATDNGLYTCEIQTTPIQTQRTRLIVTVEPRPPVIDSRCLKPAFTDAKVSECAVEPSDELPWYYNSTQGECVQHTEQSCAWGTENHFATMSDCWNFCLDDCYAQSETGPCRGELTRYHYDHPNDRCLPFTYGGCQGNRNNFKSVEECEDKCASVKYRSTISDTVPRIEQRSIGCSGNCPWREWLHYIQHGCSPVYEDNSCCPVRFDCKTKSNIQVVEDSTISCKFNNTEYTGGKLISMSDHCLSCPCIADFDSVRSIGPQCHLLGCNETEMAIHWDKGCIPIYEENVCCPIDWQCPPSLNTKFRQGGKKSIPKEPEDLQCFYGGQGYAQGFQLVTGHRACLDCSCMTPPTFTCIAFSCPDPQSASNDTLRCIAIPSFSGECCPAYKCWSVLTEVDHVGLPLTKKEKDTCNANPCDDLYECRVNYTQCHLGECQRNCDICATPLCEAHSRYVNDQNHCPYCVGPRTPEDACEWSPNYCSPENECVVDDVKCRQGDCAPACLIQQPMIIS